MPFTKFTNLDFDQIKTSIKDYLRANSEFTDFDFEGSNFSILIDTLAYNSYITAFNSNMIVNESFLDSAILRKNVVSLAGNIGYNPRSISAAEAEISFSILFEDTSKSNLPQKVTLRPGLVATASAGDESYTFVIPESITVTPTETKTETGTILSTASFDAIKVYQGTFLESKFTYDGSLDQKFILNNPNVDTSSIRVFVNKTNISGDGIEYKKVDNIIDVNSNSRIYIVREVEDEKYELKFGDGIFGKKLGEGTYDDGTEITVKYITTDGEDGNGANRFTFIGTVEDENSNVINGDIDGSITVITNTVSQNGNKIEPIDSVRYFAPITYSSQNRAVTSQDYEAIIKKLYPNTESVSIVGGEELDPPEFGNVIISIKPISGSYVSDFNKKQILSGLKKYTVSGINQQIIDLKLLYVELESNVYYNDSFVSESSQLKTNISNTLVTYSKSTDLNKFGGRFKYSKIQQIIDNVDRNAITSNITKVIIRRDLRTALNENAQYELCYGNQFHVNAGGKNIKSTGFKIFGNSSTVYLTDIPNKNLKTGKISIIKIVNDNEYETVVDSAGSVDYVKGEIQLFTVNITSTDKVSNIIEIQAVPESNDVVGLKDLYITLDAGKSKINMVRDIISSGDEVSGVKFIKDSFTSSYYNGKLTRK
tara:strand:+ start:425 stop:2383 length:1959 start_codon:yes stop_codon:yes gene_type:complete